MRCVAVVCADNCWSFSLLRQCDAKRVSFEEYGVDAMVTGDREEEFKRGRQLREAVKRFLQEVMLPRLITANPMHNIQDLQKTLAQLAAGEHPGLTVCEVHSCLLLISFLPLSFAQKVFLIANCQEVVVEISLHTSLRKCVDKNWCELIVSARLVAEVAHVLSKVEVQS